MTEVECRQCGTPFDTDREPSTPGVDTDRCPYCGTVAQLEESDVDGDGPETATVQTAGAVVRVTVEIVPDP